MVIVIMKKSIGKHHTLGTAGAGLFIREIMKQQKFHQNGMHGFTIALISLFKEKYILGKKLTNRI
jgi:hypothetical protein